MRTRRGTAACTYAFIYDTLNMQMAVGEGELCRIYIVGKAPDTNKHWHLLFRIELKELHPRTRRNSQTKLHPPLSGSLPQRKPSLPEGASQLSRATETASLNKWLVAIGRILLSSLKLHSTIQNLCWMSSLRLERFRMELTCWTGLPWMAHLRLVRCLLQ